MMRSYEEKNWTRELGEELPCTILPFLTLTSLAILSYVVHGRKASNHHAITTQSPSIAKHHEQMKLSY